MTVVRFKNLNVGRSRPSNKFQTHGTGKDMPKEVGRTTMDAEVKSWLKDGPILGSHEPIHVQRAAHDRFIDTNKPPIGKVEHLGLDGPHGTIPIRCFHPSKPS